MLTGIKAAFHRQIMADVEVAKANQYNPQRFLNMVLNDLELSVGIAHKLLAARQPQEGFFRMRELDMVERTIEFRATEEKWAPLFSDAERAEARRRINSVKGHRPSPT